jgi:hypothetical protein
MASKYGKYLSKEIIVNSKYSKITAPAIEYRGDRGGNDLHFNWSCITQPMTMDQEPEVSDRDQFLLFASSNVEDVYEFCAEVEVPIGEKKQVHALSEPTFVYVPAGMPLGPVKFKNVSKPVTLWHYLLDTKYSENWCPDDYSKLFAKPGLTALGGSSVVQDGMVEDYDEPDVKVTEMGGRPFRHIRVPQGGQGLSCWCKPLGIQAQLCAGMFVVSYRDWCAMEPIHYHTKFDEWLFFIGGNALNVEEFDARIEMFWGEEQECQTVDSTCIAHVPPGLVHVGQEHRRVGKPFWESINVAGTGDYFAEIEKIVISREECGEPMITEGAADWVPVTRTDK